jgi:hypothetical protein
MIFGRRLKLSLDGGSRRRRRSRDRILPVIPA